MVALAVAVVVLVVVAVVVGVVVDYWMQVKLDYLYLTNVP